MLLGNIAFIGAWVVVLMHPTGWQVLGPVLLGLFLLIRVGGAWLYASRTPDPSGRVRRSAVATTVIALFAVGLWVFTLLRGPG
ncbi:hypothetical protein JGU66_06250 [Myxococcaceae bacterium JPH2]|nr:hypothetical protein [Myxococcaceae bacterium JPH2]